MNLLNHTQINTQPLPPIKFGIIRKNKKKKKSKNRLPRDEMTPP